MIVYEGVCRAAPGLPGSATFKAIYLFSSLQSYVSFLLHLGGNVKVKLIKKEPERKNMIRVPKHISMKRKKLSFLKDKNN